ncbi:hypothetical protein [Ruegeria sp. HKCCD8929]|uniref:hypothetical protein n=1 Tax=Ruegeria sp. HKCCD8929 TaxID=2683006 RepID=UPI001487CC24|nr:hypothetical protein [Ruegeria sp. HKCCD8929]
MTHDQGSRKVDNWPDIEDEAWEFIRRGELGLAEHKAREALEQEPNAIDCYVILSRAARTQAEKVALLREGARIGDEQWEKEILAAPSDDFTFWANIDTRPFMRALQSLSLALATDPREGTLEEAVAIWRKLYKICPNDNLGVRFLIQEYEANGKVELDGY